MKWFRYVFTNLIYYSRERPIDAELYNDLVVQLSAAHIADNDAARKRVITDMVLATVGLRTCDVGLPWYVPLSKIQKSWADKVSEYGYKVTVL